MPSVVPHGAWSGVRTTHFTNKCPAPASPQMSGIPGGVQVTSTDKLQIVSQGGGTVDSVNAVEHISPNGKEFFFDFGTCQV